MDFSKRRKKLQALMRGKQEFLITKPSDIFYYSGYNPLGLAFLLASKDKFRMTVFGTENEAETIRGIEVRTIKKVSDIKKMFLTKNIGIDERTLSAEIYTTLKKWNLKVTPSARIIQSPRTVKEEGETGEIKKAIKLTKSSIASIGIYGKTEDHVKREIECEFICRGGEKAFDPIIASGYNSAFVHHNPTTKKIVGKYEFVILDVGAKVNGYCSDITRSFYPPFKKAKKIYDCVYQIQKSLIKSIKPGVKVSSIQKLYEKMMAKKGYKVMHSFGHGIGLDVHEPLGEKFKENMVLTVEPGIYIRGFGGCRIEDMVVVKKNGARVIS